MQGSLEKTVLEPDFPFRLFFNNGYMSTPHHWHEDIEIIYIVEGSIKVGVGNHIYKLEVGDILIIGSGEVHYFFKQMEFSKRAVIQFRISIYDNFLSGTKDTRSVKLMFIKSQYFTKESEIYSLIESQIKELIRENSEAKEGYKFILKARLYDLAGILLRYMPKNDYSLEEESRQREKLQKLDRVFQYVEKNYEKHIDLDQIAKVAGFNSVKSFNRVFKDLKGCTPMEYRRTVK